MTNMNAHITRTNTIGRHLSKAQVDELGRELDALRERIRADLGEKDVAHIKKIIRLQRRLEIGGRAAIYAGIFNPVAWVGGVAALGAAKILDNMEIGHNIMHGQYDWTNDPELRGKTFEWDTSCPGDQWRHSHNFMHHTYTNIVGKDRDVGYGTLRVADEQPWYPAALLQPLYAFWLMVFFEWGVALHDLEIDRLWRGERQWQDVKPLAKAIAKKGGRQILKDYLLFPLLAGPFFLPVLLGNIVANLIRNVWTFVIIFCGHFPDGVETFTEEETQNETRGEWYVRQMLGSSNITGGRWFHIMSGHLSHQIEHHLFPDIPAQRYPEMGPEVEKLCAKYGIPYNTGSLGGQFASVVKRIFRLSLPGQRKGGNPVMA